MEILILVDDKGNQIVKRRIEAGENLSDVFKEEKDKYFKSLNNGN